MPKLLILLFIFLVGELYAQSTGYGGKKFIIKTDAINGIRLGFTNADLEMVVARNISVTAAFRHFAYTQPNSKVSITGEVNPGGDRDVRVFEEHTKVFPGETRGWLATIGMKYYFNKIIPAPSGFYASVDLGYGQADLNFDHVVTYKNVDPFEPYTYSPPGSGFRMSSSANCSLFYFTFPAVGYQIFFFNLLTLDAKFSIDWYYIDLSENIVEKYPYSYVSSNLISAQNGHISFGPSVYLKVGFLLF